jgi:MoxR-like ATPase
LPEAQLDRFLLLIKIGYPTEEEFAILNRTTGTKKADVKAVITAEEIIQAQALVRQVTINEDLTRYVSESSALPALILLQVALRKRMGTLGCRSAGRPGADINS